MDVISLEFSIHLLCMQHQYMEKSSNEKHYFTTAKPSSIPKPTLDKINALLFVSAISVLSWLPLVIVNVNYLVFVQGLDIPRRFLFVDIINILNLSNSILNPFVYALRIPEFRQAQRVSCCSRRQDVMNRPGIVGREFMAAVLTPVLQRRAIQYNSNQVQQIYGKEIMDTKL